VDGADVRLDVEAQGRGNERLRSGYSGMRRRVVLGRMGGVMMWRIGRKRDLRMGMKG
jgi:hypothetical protein